MRQPVNSDVAIYQHYFLSKITGPGPCNASSSSDL